MGKFAIIPTHFSNLYRHIQYSTRSPICCRSKHKTNYRQSGFRTASLAPVPFVAHRPASPHDNISFASTHTCPPIPPRPFSPKILHHSQHTPDKQKPCVSPRISTFHHLPHRVLQTKSPFCNVAYYFPTLRPCIRSLSIVSLVATAQLALYRHAFAFLSIHFLFSSGCLHFSIPVIVNPCKPVSNHPQRQQLSSLFRNDHIRHAFT